MGQLRVLSSIHTIDQYDLFLHMLGLLNVLGSIHTVGQYDLSLHMLDLLNVLVLRYAQDTCDGLINVA